MLADLFVMAVVVIFIFIGYKTGFMKAFINIVSYILSIVLSFLCYPIVSGWLQKTPLYTYLIKSINENYISGNIAQTNEGAWGVISGYFGNEISAAATNVSEGIAVMIINIIAFILVVILFKIAIRLIGNTLNIFTKLPVIKQFNRLGGAVLGGGAGILVIYIIFALIVIAAPFESGSKIMTEIDRSTFADELYENNFVLNFMDKGE